jgi:hypothetical protein
VVVVVVAPGAPIIIAASETTLVNQCMFEALVSEVAVEALDLGVLDRLTGTND